MNLFDVAVKLMQGDAATLMRRLAHLELAKEYGMVKAHKMVGPDGPFEKRDTRMKSVVVTGKSDIPALKAIYTILREHIENPTGYERFDRSLDAAKKEAKTRGEKFRFVGKKTWYIPLDSEMEILSECLNGNVMFCHAMPVKDGQGWRVQRAANPLRNVAECLVYYLEHFENPALLKHDPIKICPGCDAIYFKAKASQEYCSTNCRVSAWGKKQGKEYFRVKQAEYRATLKAQEERLSRKK